MDVTYHLIDADGALHTTGEFGRYDVDLDLEEITIPHLHRVSRDGKWLASFDIERKRLVVRNVGGDASGAPMRMWVRKLRGTIDRFRWLDDGSGFVFLTSRRLYLVRPKFERGQKQVRAIPFFSKGKRPKWERRITEFRVLPGAIIAQTRQQLYYITTGQERVVHDLTPDKMTVRSASVRSGGRIAMSLVPYGSMSVSEIWTLQPPPPGVPVEPSGDSTSEPAARPTVVDKTSCKGCATENWAPGSTRLTTGGRGFIYREVVQEDGSIHLKTLPRSRDFRSVVSLWANTADDRILAADVRKLSLWNQHGDFLWQWKPAKGIIYSARFAPNGEDVVVTGSYGIYLLRAGKVVSELISREVMAKLPSKEEGERYFDGAILLADGSLAFAVVLEEFREEY